MTLAESLLVEDSSTVRNVTFGSAGIAVMFCRPSSSILQNAPCAVENLVIEGLLGLWISNIGERE